MNARVPLERIVLTGFMCAGKTTVARTLAVRLVCAMLDTDDAIVEREGRSIASIIDTDGEARFRQLETATLLDALQTSDARVIALGGGAWTIEENRALVAAAHDCLTVWLDAPFELCWQRIVDSHDARPLAREREQAHALYTARRAAYELAALRVETNDKRSAEDTAAEIMSIIRRQKFSDEHEGREGENTHG